MQTLSVSIRTGSVRAAAAFAILVLVLVGCRAHYGARGRYYAGRDGRPPRPLNLPAQPPKPSSLCLFAGKYAQTQPAEVLTTARLFRVTRIIADVTPDTTFIAEAEDRGIRVQAILDPVLATGDWQRHTDFLKRDMDEAPQVRADGAAWGCPAAPGFVDYYVARAEALLDAGAEGLHVPDFAMDGYCLSAAGNQPGDLDRCYCRHCIRGFQQHLRQHDVTIPDMFDVVATENLDYLTHMIREKVTPNQLNSPLEKLYEEYNRQRLYDFWAAVRTRLDNWAGRRVLITAGNVTTDWEPFAGPFDAGFTTVDAATASPSAIYRMMQGAQAARRPQFFIPRAASDADMARLIGAITAAGGIACVPEAPEPPATGLPWPAAYAKFYHFLRDQKDLITDYRDVATAGPGLADGRYTTLAPVNIVGGDGQVTAIMRKSERYAGEPVVIHLLDWSSYPQAFTLGLDPNQLFGNLPLQFTLLRPGHAPLQLAGGTRAGIELPALDPWAILVIGQGLEERTTWSPLPIEQRDPRSPNRALLQLLPVIQPGEVHYTVDGREPTADSPVYSGAMTFNLQHDVQVRAITVGRRGPSAETVLTLRLRPQPGIQVDRPVPGPDIALMNLDREFTEPPTATVTVNQMADGSPLQIARRQVQGLAVVAPAQLRYRISDYYVTFVGTVGVPLSLPATIGVRCQVRTGREVLWESPVLRNLPSEREVPVRVDLPAGASTLVLGTFAAGGDGEAVAIWADPGFILKDVPGTIIAESPPASKQYLAFPSIVSLPGDALLASYNITSDYPEWDDPARCQVMYSANGGDAWERRAELPGLFGASLFEHNGALYLLGSSGAVGALVVRRSTDQGQTWSDPVSKATGIIDNTPRYSCRPTAVWHSRRRLWLSVGMREERGGRWLDPAPGVVSIPLGADLLDGDNWALSNRLPVQRDWIKGDAESIAWIPGSIVMAPDGRMVQIAPLTIPPLYRRAAVLRVSDDGEAVKFRPRDGIIDLIGGGAGFTVRFDPQTKCYWALTNRVSNADTPWQRNIVSLLCSPDLVSWEYAGDILRSDEDANDVAFQNVAWQFAGPDIVAVSQTAYRGARGWQYANFVTFHRIAGFRDLKPAVAPPRTRQAPPSHLIAAWDFEEDERGIMADKATAGRNGDSAERLGEARVREGIAIVPTTVGSGFLCPPSPDINLTGPLTIYARIKLAAAPSSPVGIVEKNRTWNPEIRCYGLTAVAVDGDPDSFAVVPEVSANRHRSVCLNGIPQAASKPLPLNQWVNIAMVVRQRQDWGLEVLCLARLDNEPRWQVIFDPVSEPRIDKIYEGPVPISLGNHRELMPAAECLRLDEVRIYNRDLTSFELSDIVPGELTPGATR